MIGYRASNRMLGKVIGRQDNYEGDNAIVRSGLNEVNLGTKFAGQYITEFNLYYYGPVQVRQHLIRPKGI